MKRKQTSKQRISERKSAFGASKNKSAPRTLKEYSALTSEDQEKWNRVVHAISKMRSDGVSLHKAAREAGVSSRVVATLGGAALRKSARGRYAVKPKDQLLRVLIIPSPGGLREVPVNDSATASRIAEYSDAVQKYLRTGDTSKLKRFRRMKLKDAKRELIHLLTDPAELSRQGSAGVLSFESLYARIA